MKLTKNTKLFFKKRIPCLTVGRKYRNPPLIPQSRAVKFCFTRGEMPTRQVGRLKFFPKIWGSTGVRGMFKEYLSHNIPPSPFKGGEIPCKKPDFLQKMQKNNCLKICKIELNSPAFKRGEIPCKSPNFVQKIYNFRYVIYDFAITLKR